MYLDVSAKIHHFKQYLWHLDILKSQKHCAIQMYPEYKCVFMTKISYLHSGAVSSMAFWQRNFVAVPSGQLRQSHPNVHVILCHHGHCSWPIQMYHATWQATADSSCFMPGLLVNVLISYRNVNSTLWGDSTDWIHCLSIHWAQWYLHFTLLGYTVWYHATGLWHLQVSNTATFHFQKKYCSSLNFLFKYSFVV